MTITITPSTQPNGFQIDENTPGTLSGYLVKGNGDINNDGFQDFVILAAGANQLNVIYGGNNLTTLSTLTPDVINLDSLNPFGVSVSLGDIDGNGFDDHIVGNSNANASANGGTQGATRVVWGDSLGGPPINLSSLGTAGFTIINDVGSNISDSLGFSVSSGNINGDFNISNSIDDLILADPSKNETYVIFGNATKYTGTLDISAPPPSSVSTISGAANSSFGFSVSSGDINGDNKDDVIVGAPDATVAPNANSFHGKAYVVSGNVIFPDTTISLSVEEEKRHIHQIIG